MAAAAPAAGSACGRRALKAVVVPDPVTDVMMATLSMVRSAVLSPGRSNLRSAFAALSLTGVLSILGRWTTVDDGGGSGGGGGGYDFPSPFDRA